MTETSRLRRRSLICAEKGAESCSNADVRSARVLHALPQLRTGFVRRQRVHGQSVAIERILRNIDAVDVPVIGAAILQMIDDLQRRAERVVGRPGRAALAMDIEHEAADRHRRIGAIVNQIVPIPIAALGDVHAKGRQQVLRMARRKIALGQSVRARAGRRRRYRCARARCLPCAAAARAFRLPAARYDRRCRRRRARTGKMRERFRDGADE